MTSPAPQAGQRLAAAFSSVPLFVPLFAAAGGAIAQSTEPVALAPVVVVGSRTPLAANRVTADVVVIDAERIRASTADSLEDLLRREAGLQLSRSGGPGQSAGVFIRGAASNSTVVIVDGVRVGSATLGYAAFEGLGLAQIERIEVLRGPASSLYGADAVGGVVQISTRRGDAGNTVAAQAAVGGKASAKGSLSFSQRFGAGVGNNGAFDAAGAISHERSDGVSAIRPNDRFGSYNPDADGFERTSTQLRLGYTPAAGHRLGANVIDSRLKAAYDSAIYPAPSFKADPSPDFRSKLHTQVASLDYDGQINPLWRTTLQLAHNGDDSENAIGIPSAASHFVTKRDQASWQNTLTPGAGQQWVLALERQRERAESTSYKAVAERTNTAAVLGYSGAFGAQSVQADLRRDDNSVYGGVTTGRLGWSLAFAPQWRVRALAGNSFRAPSFNDLVFPNYGVITVQPERGRSVEAGLAWQAADGSSRASVTVYQNRVKQLIAYQSDPKACPTGYTFGCASNIASARLRGLTLDGSQRLGAWQFGGVLDFLSADDLATGQRLVRRAPRQLSLNADYSAGAWHAGAALLAVGQRTDGITLGGYATVDLKAGWRFAPKWQLEASLLNATDRDLQPVRDYQGVGRQAWLGLRYDGQGL